MNGALQRHAKSRGLALAAIALAALAARLSVPPPPPRSIEGVAAALGAAAGATVRPDDFLWEERGGFIEDTFLGRRVLFLASRDQGGASAPRDLYRARVRLTPDGRPISVTAVRNLTHTPHGDDRDLTGAGHHVAFATATPDGVQGVTLLDLHPDPAPAPFPARLLAPLDRWLATGTSRGLARTEIAFTHAPPEIKFEVAPAALVLALGPEATPAALDFATHTLQTGRTNPFGAAAQSIPDPRRPGGEVVTALLGEALGPASASALRSVIARPPLVPPPHPAPAAPDGPRIAADYPTDGGWPPAPLPPAHPKPFDGEGFWHAPVVLAPVAQQTPPAMVEAILRPDTTHPDALVHLTAIDTRRLELRLTPGVASPEPTTGPRGSGLLPRGPSASRVIAAFVAGPPPSPQPLGFFGEGRLLAPLVPGAPAVALRPDGRAALGPWPESASRDAFVAIAQAPDALADVADRTDPKAADTARFAPAGASARTGRAALCRTKSGYLIHAFAPAAPAATLRAALSLAGCVSALHLGTSPAPLGFAYTKSTTEGDSTTYTGKIAWPPMTMPLDHLGGPWPQETGILVERDPTPATSKNATWTADTGTQPAPTWLPSIFTAETEQLGTKVKLHAFLPDRAAFRLAPGKDESVSARGEKPALSEQDRTSALAAFGISVAKRAQRRGLLIGGTQLARPSATPVWLTLEGPRLSITRPGTPPPPTADATEVTLVADERALLPAAREVGTQRPRTALCVFPEGTVLFAHSSFDTDEANTEALLDAGCDRVVSLDRGAHDGIFVHRAGTDHPPEATYEATAIYVLSIPATGTASDF